ncbi:Uncharacterized protein conserved in archaea [Archaeoglobus sulfaticallidus PM70-1]|uniref:Uncharacterized protein conserved in archaea n=1 Tax=Archaeoglobus sulfaticallidus PM70-1 TaxID=387631 RepID=N0BDC8_9EURY|nr:prenyltransferase/squalene oxidase repeat-containing protein [Archaeoglobus sulfaticallidus]AGK61629.1 Uncharacterized protein conserved in archaea [Archaeoglobus sulfaticallidus PM70-1]
MFRDLATKKLSKNLCKKIIRYVQSRRVENGFAFCKPLPPSLAETYYSLSILTSLGLKIDDKNKIVKFLLNSVKKEPYSLFYTLQSLRLLGEDIPDYRETLYTLGENIIGRIHRPVREIDKGGITATYSFDSPNILRELYLINSCLKLYSERLNLHMILKNFRSQGGFGLKFPNLRDTFYCIDFVEDKKETAEFIKKFEVEGGFAKSPKSYPPYLEETYYAISSLYKLNYTLDAPEKTRNFILTLQNPDGGFRRSIYCGISTLENTFYAVKSLEMIDLMV